MLGVWRAELAECMGWLLEPAQAEMGYPVGTASLEQACRCRSSPACLTCCRPRLLSALHVIALRVQEQDSRRGRPECAQC